MIQKSYVVCVVAHLFAGLLLMVSSPACRAQENSYNPLQVDAQFDPPTVLFEFQYQPQLKSLRGDAGASEPRTVPIKVYLPAARPAPVVLFSHGLGGSREGFKHGGEHWAKRGYVGVFIQHPGSDDSVWRNRQMGQRMNAAREAANAQNLLLRIQDVKAVIDYLEKIQQNTDQVVEPARQLQGRMELKHIGMSGHSFGAITTQMVSGQSPGVPTQNPNDQRIKAALILSPSPPKIGQPERSFSKVSIPWMLMTGTKDNSPIGDMPAESRLKVFPALPPGQKYQVVFAGGTHGFLGERIGITSNSGATGTHAQATVALSTAFWDVYLKGDEQAKKWLDGDGPKSLLAPDDRWDKR